MKAVYILIALGLIGAGYYLFTQQDATDMSDGIESEEEMTEDTTSTDADAAADDATEDDDSMLDADVSAEAEVDVDADTTTQVIDLDGFNFGYSMDEIRVSEGDTVTINLTSTDGFHDWVVDEFDAATERVRDGETTSVTFVADTAGTYEFYCSVGNHRAEGMVGTLIVE